MPYELVTLGGDGTGPEVMREGMRVLNAVSEPLGLTWDIEDIPAAASTTSSTATRLAAGVRRARARAPI
jgi:isocitrate/isopropylmalate dehydrogenase